MTVSAATAAAHERIPPKVEPCSPGREIFHRRADQHRAHRDATRQRLGDAQNIGGNAVVLVGENLAGAPKPGLHFVNHQ